MADTDKSGKSAETDPETKPNEIDQTEDAVDTSETSEVDDQRLHYDDDADGYDTAGPDSERHDVDALDADPYAEDTNEISDTEFVEEIDEILNDAEDRDESEYENTEYEEPEQPEPPADPEPVAAAEPPKSRGFVGGLVGGVLAAGVGFLAAQIFPDNWPIDFSNSELRGQIADQQGTLETLSTTVAELSTSLGAQTAMVEEGVGQVQNTLSTLQSTDTDLQQRLDATIAETSGQIAALSDQLAEISGQFGQLETSALTDSDNPAITAALEAYGKQVEALNQSLSADVEAARAALDDRLAAAEAKIDEEIARNAALVEDQAAAEAAAEAAAVAAADAQALLEVQSALEVGEPFAEPLAQIETIEIPEILTANAESGIPSLDTLKDEMPPLAREALNASRRETVGDGAGDRLTTFLQTQLGVRSLEPREGDDPDAVLSRAEAALVEGRLEQVIETLAVLPESGQAIMAEFVERVRLRHDVVTATDALSDSLNSN